MKINPVVLIAVLLSTLNSQLSTCFGQGALTPPGAPAPTMKSLDQIESRTPISSAPFTIVNPGSYYVTSNLTVSSGNAITIATNGVTLDLNGFTLRSTVVSPSGYGILLNSGLRDITIANGHIQGGVTNNNSGVYSGTGFGYGIYYSGNQPVNVLVSRISVSGCLNYGIYLNFGDSTVVESCTVRTVGSVGIYASTIKQSSAIDCGGTAIEGDQISDCRGQCSGTGTGIYANGTAQNCWGQSNSGRGLYAFTAQNSLGQSSGSSGIVATTAQDCYGYSRNSFGVYAYNVASGCYGESSSGTGLYAQIAAFCSGYCLSSTAIQATVANGCYAASGTNNITFKYNMP